MSLKERCLWLSYKNRFRSQAPRVIQSTEEPFWAPVAAFVLEVEAGAEPLGEAVWPDCEEEEDVAVLLLSHWTKGQVELLSTDCDEYSEGVVTMSRSKSIIRPLLLLLNDTYRKRFGRLR